MVLVCLKRIQFCINKPLNFCVPMKLKHFTQLAKNTQKHLLFFLLPTWEEHTGIWQAETPPLSGVWSRGRRGYKTGAHFESKLKLDTQRVYKTEGENSRKKRVENVFFLFSFAIGVHSMSNMLDNFLSRVSHFFQSCCLCFCLN